MVAIPLPYGSAPGFRAQEGAGRLINCFAEPLGEGRQDAKRIRVPGMTQFLTSAQTGFRGMFLEPTSGILYVAFKDTLYKGTSAGGALAPVGGVTLAGSGTVYFARNNKVVLHKTTATPPPDDFNALSPDVALVTGGNAFWINLASSAVAPAFPRDEPPG